MRQAPPVGVTCSAGWRWRAAQAGLAAVAAATFLAWALLHAGAADALAAGAAAGGALVAGLLVWRVARARPVVLAWDGERWSADSQPCGVRLMLDLGVWMLLRCDNGRWLALERAEAGASWHGLRCALHAPPVRRQGA